MCSTARVIDVCDDTLAESSHAEQICMFAHLVMLCECSEHSSLVRLHV